MVQPSGVSPCSSPLSTVAPTNGQKINFLGTTTEEKTRNLLGWTDGFQPTIASKLKMKAKPEVLHRPYSIPNRRYSSPCFPPPSPHEVPRAQSVGMLPPPPPYFVAQHHNAKETFEKLREIVPTLSNKSCKYRDLISLVSNVSELEARLTQLKENTRDLNAIISERIATAKANGVQLPQELESYQDHASVPDDLLNIDVTAFKCMVSSPTGSSNPSPMSDPLTPTPSHASDGVYHERHPSSGSPYEAKVFNSPPSNDAKVFSPTNDIKPEEFDDKYRSEPYYDYDIANDMPAAFASSIETLSIDTKLSAW